MLLHLVNGRSNKAIAEVLALAEVTVKLHICHGLVKLEILGRTQAATAAVQRGIVHLN